MYKELDFGKLIDITVKVLKFNNISRLISLNLSRICNYSILDQICSEYFGNTDYKNKIRVFKIWERNVNNFTTEVNLRLSANFNKNHHFQINISKKEWFDQIEKNKVSYNERNKFNSDFADYLSNKLQCEKKLKCWLKFTSNWFKKQNSKKKKAPLWKGVLECIDANCSNKFNAIIENNHTLEKFKYIKIDIFPDINNKNHENFIQKISRCTGFNREQTAKDLINLGITNVESNNIIYNFSEATRKKVSNRLTLAKIKSEFINKNKISNEISVDSLATKYLTNELCLNVIPGFVGYMHDLGLDPFGFILFSGIQVIKLVVLSNSMNYL